MRGDQDFRLVVDGQAVRLFHPLGPSFQALSTIVALTAGPHTIAFVGANSDGGDHTALIDDIRIGRTTAPAPTSPAGMNLPANGFQAVGPVWVNAFNTLNPWGQWGSPWAIDPSIKVDAAGYPLTDAGAGTPMHGYPLGTYTLRFRGTGTVDIIGIGHLSGSIVKGADGISRAQVVVDKTYEQTGSQLYVRLRNVSRTDPIRDLQLIMPGYDPEQSPTFTDEFLHRLQPFATLRFMDWERTNGSPVRNWSDRAPAGAPIQATDRGVSYEYIAELANETGKSPWVTIPTGASDDFVRQFARLLAQKLDPGLTVYVEYGNELWNWNFLNYGINLADAKANPLLTASDDYTRAAQQAAYRTMQVGQIFRDEFAAAGGDGADRVHTVLGGQAAMGYFQSAGLQFLADHYGPPKQFITELAIAPYITAPSDPTGMTLDDLFANLEQKQLPQVASRLSWEIQLADRYGLPVVAYEAGQSLVDWSGRPAVVALYRQAQHDPRMGQLLDEYFALWKSDGGGVLTYYKMMGLEQPWSNWGALTSLDEPGSVKWDAMLSSYLEPGDLTLDGKVNDADFEVLAAHYGQAGTWWWEQGDLNGDHLVDGADLAILRAHLRGLTASEAVAVGLLDVPSTGTTSRPVQLRGVDDPAVAQRWTVTRNGLTVASGDGPNLDFTPTVLGNYVVRLTATTGGVTATDRRTVKVLGLGTTG